MARHLLANCKEKGKKAAHEVSRLQDLYIKYQRASGNTVQAVRQTFPDREVQEIGLLLKLAHAATNLDAIVCRVMTRPEEPEAPVLLTPIMPWRKYILPGAR